MKATTQIIKNRLLSGEELTVQQMDKLASTNNSAEIIRRLRESGMTIEMRWERNEKTKKFYGVYSTPKQKKVNRIKTGEYVRA